MKPLVLRWGYRLFLGCIFLCTQFILWAQDAEQKVTTKTTTTRTEWYSAPWVWVAGGALFIILLVALLRGGSSTNSETRTTVIKDNR